MNSAAFRRLSMLITIIFAASLMVFVTGVFAQSATPVGETEITGELESISSGSIVVSGQTISIIGAEINNVLTVGSSVKVHVSTVNGVLTAREVETTNRTNDDDSNTNANANSNDNSNTNLNSNDNTDDNSNDNTSVVPVVNLQQAIDIVLAVYPTTDILSVELTTKFGGTQVWEVKIRNGIELNIDSQTALILTIDRPGDDDDNGNSNSNDNRDDNGGNSNSNVNSNSNDNRDDDGGNSNGNVNNNSNDNRDDDGGNDNNDDDSGSGRDDSGSDDDDD